MNDDLNGVVSVDLSRSPEIPPESESIEARVTRFAVTDEKSYAEAAALIQSSAAVIAKVEGFFKDDKDLAHRLHASICEKIRSFTAPWRSVRSTLEPKMKRFRSEQERIRREEETRLQREVEAAERKAREDAAKLQADADQAAAALRRDGDVRAAREAEAWAALQVQSKVAEAVALADVGVVLPDSRPAGGPGESRPWVGEVTDIKALCKAIGEGKVALEYLMPVRGKGDQMVPLIEVNPAVLNYIAKRLGKEDLGIPGVVGKRDLTLRFSKTAAPVQPGQAPQKQEDGW